MKRKLCLALAVLMLLSTAALFTSCSNGSGDGSSTTVTTAPTPGNGGNGGTVDLYADLPTGNYNGYEVQFLNASSSFINTIVPEDTTDTVDAAIFARNSFVKEKLQVNLKEINQTADNVKKTMTQLTSSNDFEYDIVFNTVYRQTPLAQSGTYTPVDEMTSYINLNKPWWFKDTMDSISVNGKGFELFGDIHLYYYESIWGMVFNQEDFIDNKQTFPYDLVRSGDWTLEEMEKIMKATYKKPGEEHYAIVGHKDLISAMMVASGFELVSQDYGDVLKVFEDEVRFVDTYTKIMNVFFTSNGPNKMNMIIADYKSEAYKSGIFDGFEFQTSFITGKGTFMGGTIGDIRIVRSSEFQYGIIPLPKIHDDQEQYVSMVVNYAYSLGVPATNPYLEQTCVIIENLAAYSYKLVKHEYYDVVVQGRTVRDNDSIEMLDIIFGHTDLGVTYLGIDTTYRLGLSDQIRKSMSDNVTEIMVDIDGIMGSVATNVESLIEAYK